MSIAKEPLRFGFDPPSLRIMAPMNKDLLAYNISDIAHIMKEAGQPAFRVKQLTKWVYQDGVFDYANMTNLPQALRDALAKQVPIVAPSIIDKQISNDGTRKYVFEYADGTRVEAVGIPSEDSKESRNEPKHLTVCFSTQAGCAMACAFCATGEEGLQRNLSSGEMVCQVLLVQQDFECRVTNVVSMGQGEPFQNYDAVLETLRFLNSKNGLEIGARHITVSTCGLVKGIDTFAQEPEQFTLAISLHAARQQVRDNLMPRCASMTLPQLKGSLLSYVQATGRRVSLEYLLIDGVNDTSADLDALLTFCKGLLCHINLIPINSVAGSKFRPSKTATQKHWVAAIKAAGKECTIRNSRGSDIDGACGQLKNKLASNNG